MSTDPHTPPEAPPEARRVRQRSFGWYIQNLASEMNARMDAELGQLGLTRHHFGVLMILLDEEGLSQAEIGKRINLPGYATTRGMDALEAKGLVERRADAASRRANKVYLTPDARALAPRLFAIVGKVNDGMADGLSAEQKQALLEALQVMFANTRSGAQ